MGRKFAEHVSAFRRTGLAWISFALLLLTIVGLLTGCGAQMSRTTGEPTQSATTAVEPGKPAVPTDPEPEPVAPDKTTEPQSDYIANLNTHKFHYPWCSSVDQMKESNKWYFNGTADELIEKGYEPCGRCKPAPEPVREPEPAPEPEPTISYIANTNTHKFHYPWCSSVDQMKESNKWYFTGTRDELIAMGYDPCGRCHP